MNTLIVSAIGHSLWIAAIIHVGVWFALKLLPKNEVHFRVTIALGGVYLIPLLLAVQIITQSDGGIQSIAHSTSLRSSTLHSAIAWIWTCGAIFMLGRIALHWREAHLITQEAEKISDVELLQCFQAILHRVGTQRDIKLAFSDEVMVPSVSGLLKSTILLPPCYISGLTMDELEAILAHEIAHVVRWDAIHAVLEALIKAAFFFNPFVHALIRISAHEREAACDRFAANLIESPKPLATGLLKLSLEKANNSLLLTAARPHPNSLVLERVDRLVGPSKMNQPKMLGWKHVLLSICAMMIGLTIAVQSTRITTTDISTVELILLKDDICDIMKRDEIYWNPLYDEGGPATVAISSGQVFMNGVELPPSTSKSIASIFDRYQLAQLGHSELRYFGNKVELTIKVHSDGGTVTQSFNTASLVKAKGREPVRA